MGRRYHTTHLDTSEACHYKENQYEVRAITPDHHISSFNPYVVTPHLHKSILSKQRPNCGLCTPYPTVWQGACCEVMAANSSSIYTGMWVNWSHGYILGSTITLSGRNGALLTAFISTFIAIVGGQLWKILCYILHQCRVSQEPNDGLYYQQQNVLRNSNTPGGAAWSFVLQFWHWRGRAHHWLTRSLPWVLFSISYLVIFAVLSVFGSSEVVKAAGQDRLIRASQCGYWAVNETAPRSFETRTQNDSQNAAIYARNCYGGTVDPLKCNIYATSHIKWDGREAECAFKEGICLGNNSYQMDTGFIDSHYELGINTPEKERLRYRRVTTCSVLDAQSYASEKNGTPLVTFDYGPSTVAGNYTFSYIKYAVLSAVGYTVDQMLSNVGQPSIWKPAAPLNRTDADVQLIYIASNSVFYRTPVDDPVFSAHQLSNITTTDRYGREIAYFTADYYLGVIGCADQHQFCHGDTCTPLSGRKPTFSSWEGLTMTQKGILERLSFASLFTGISRVINGRSGSALRASETLASILQKSLPPNQWQLEVSSWFSTGLALLQNTIHEYVNPSNVLQSNTVHQPQNEVERVMCYNQKTQATNGTISFSTLGLGVILVAGTVVILTSLLLETVMGWIGLQSHRSWVSDDQLQQQRMLFEERGVTWFNTEGTIPVTQPGVRFPPVVRSAKGQALLAPDKKGAAVVNVREIS